MLAKREHFLACEAILERICRRHGFKLLAVAVMPTTVQLAVTTPHTVSAAECAFLPNGTSARESCEFESRFHLKYPRGHFWARGYDARPASWKCRRRLTTSKHPHNDPRQRNTRLSLTRIPRAARATTARAACRLQGGSLQVAEEVI